VQRGPRSLWFKCFMSKAVSNAPSLVCHRGIFVDCRSWCIVCCVPAERAATGDGDVIKLL
jgi:hypothetical protein